MSTQPAIRLETIGKCYRIYANPQDRFKQALKDRFGQWFLKQAHPPLYREHWALRDVTFEVAPGEAVGILGRNGAGKSTLLQIIAGTLAPTTGSIETSGRITALLELGSGFNPEFTGKENIFHNGQILGLSRADVEDKYDEIAAFADIGDFIDQPVKTYSSGMMVRLAFAVQTAVEPKVLIVDEALSVGDMFFQAKCMARINRLVDDGVALLFVSHDIGVVRQLCQRAVLLDAGAVREAGAAVAVADHYVRLQLEDRNQSVPRDSNAEAGKTAVDKITARGIRMEQDDAPALASDLAIGRAAFEQRAAFNRVRNGDAEILNVLMCRSGQPCADFDFGDEALVRIFVYMNKTLTNLNLSLKIRTLQGTDVVFLDTRLQDEMRRTYRAGDIYSFDWAVRLPLLHGSYALACGVAHPPVTPGDDWSFVDVVPHAYEFRIAPRQAGMIDGLVTLPARLEIKSFEAITGGGCE